jgi:hypothetical protein
LCSTIHWSLWRWTGSPQMQHGAMLWAVQFSVKIWWRRFGDIGRRSVGSGASMLGAVQEKRIIWLPS